MQKIIFTLTDENYIKMINTILNGDPIPLDDDYKPMYNNKEWIQKRLKDALLKYVKFCSLEYNTKLARQNIIDTKNDFINVSEAT